MILRLAIFVLLASATATTWTIVNGVNANPKGNNPPTVKNLADCEAKAEGHTQFTYNLRSGHCFVGDGTTFSGAALDHVKSGCDATRVTAGCEAPVPPSPAPTTLSWIFQTNASLGYCHMAMIERVGSANSSTFVAAFQAAKVHEGYNDQDIYVSRTSDGGVTWSPVRGRIAINTNGRFAVWGPSLHWDASRAELSLFYAQSGAFDQTSTPGRSGVGGDIMYVKSSDGGKTWGTPRLVLPYRISNLTVPKITANKLVAVASAPAEAPVWVLPFWQTPKTNDTDVQAAGVLRSADRGETWSVHMVPQQPTKLIENTIAPTRNGSLLMLFRTGVGKLYESWSFDVGMNWTTPVPSGLPNPNSKTFVMTNRAGNQVLAYNPTTKGRNPLALAISTDDGGSFKQFANLDPAIKTKDLEYPTTAQFGRFILTAFSADHYTGIKLAKTALPDEVDVDVASL